MDKNGQLTFSDDPLLQGVQETVLLLEEGNFGIAVEKLDTLLSINPDYPGLIEAYRTAKFWHNRKHELKHLAEGKETADYLMRQWQVFEDYAIEKEMRSAAAYQAVMKHIFFKASENYKISFRKQEDPTKNFDLLLNLGDCFLRLGEHKNAIDTLEYAKNSYQSNARLLSILGEAYYHTGDIPKSLLYFREAFLVDPSEIDLQMIGAAPIRELVELVKKERKDARDIREWMPIYGFLSDIFYVRRNLSKHQVETIEADIFNLEVSYQTLNQEQLAQTNIVPRLLNKYLWMLDYYEFQNYNFENIAQIRERLIGIEKKLFGAYFKK